MIDERIYAVLPLRPSIVRELIEELHDLPRTEARGLLRVAVDDGDIGLSWDGKLHDIRYPKKYDPTEVPFA